MASSGGVSKPTVTEAYSFLMDTALVRRWYDIFDHLGIPKPTLNESAKAHPCEAQLSLFDMLKVWVEREEPAASWPELVHVLRYKLLEGKIANKMARRYCPHCRSADDPGSEDEEVWTEDPLSANCLEEDSFEFSRLLMDITDKLPELTYIPLYHYLKELRCPDGTRLMEEQELKDRRTCDGLLLPLICSGLCNCRDVDLLIHLLTALGHEDLLDIIRKYVPKITMGSPSDPVLQEPTRFFAVKAVLNSAIKRVDLAVVSLVKQSLCACFNISDQPYLMQYTGGWSKDPIKLWFQLPLACAVDIDMKVAIGSADLVAKGIVCLEMEINTTVFTYPTS